MQTAMIEQLQTADDWRLGTDLLDVAKCFFFDRGQATFDISFGWLRVGEIICLMIINDLGISIEVELELLGNFFIGTALDDEMLTAGQFGSLTEEQGIAFLIELVVGITYSRVSCNSGSGI